MYFNSKLLKTILILLFIVSGLFVGYNFMSISEVEEAVSLGDYKENDETAQEGYSEEEVKEFETSLGISEQVVFNNSFEHTKPGEYSEIIVNASNLTPGALVILYVRKAGTEDYIAAGGQELTADEDGNISTRFMITEYGDYEVYLTSETKSHISPTIVVN